MRKKTSANSVSGAPPSITRLKGRVRLHDVALQAGVSQAAVARCFRHGASVAPATRAKIMQAAARLKLAHGTAELQRSNLVALVLPSPAIVHYPQVLADTSEQLARQGKRPLLLTLERESEIDGVLQELWQYRVDGAIVAACLSSRQVAEFARRDVPLVLFNRTPHAQGVPAVLCDQAEAARRLVSCLAEAGHRQFAIIDGPGDSSVAQERKAGMLDRLLELGLPAPIVAGGNDDYAGGGQGLRKVIERLGRVPDAVICGNDMMAVGCLDTARQELGIKVPAQMSVAGFDGLQVSGSSSYNITTVRQPIKEMASDAVGMLATLMARRGGAARDRRYRSSLVEGGTARLSDQGTRGPAPASLRAVA